MSEEEIIEILEDRDDFIDTLYENYRQATVKSFDKAIQGLLDLYQKEKQKNKYNEVAIKTELNFAISNYEHYEKEEMHNLALVEAGIVGILQELLEERN